MASLLFILISVYLFSCIALYFFQEKFIFFPPDPVNEVYQSVAKNEIEVTINNQQMHGWKIDVNSAKNKILFYFGGNAEDVVYLNFEAQKFSVKQCITFNYAGYGESEGEPSQQKLYENTLEIYDAIISEYKIDPKDIIIIGRSLGSSVATYLAANRKSSGLILITPFDSIEKMAADRFKIFPIYYLLKHSFPTAKYITQVKSPILMLAANEDEVIPAKNLKNLKQVIGARASFIAYPDVGHNTIQTHTNYYSDINEFIGISETL